MLVAGLLTALLLVFGVVEALEVPLLADPTEELSSRAVGTAVLRVVLPVPSSLVMVGHGAVFGVVVGAGLSLAGSLAAALLGLWLGRRGGQLVLGSVLPGRAREPVGGVQEVAQPVSVNHAVVVTPALSPALHEPGLDQATEMLGDQALHQPGRLYALGHAAITVEQQPEQPDPVRIGYGSQHDRTFRQRCCSCRWLLCFCGGGDD